MVDDRKISFLMHLCDFITTYYMYSRCTIVYTYVEFLLDPLMLYNMYSKMCITFIRIKTSRVEKRQFLNLIDLFCTNQIHRCKRGSIKLSLNCHFIFSSFPLTLATDVRFFWKYIRFVTFNYNRTLSILLNCIEL